MLHFSRIRFQSKLTWSLCSLKMKSLGFYPVFCLRPPSRPQEGDDLLKEVKSLDVQRRASPLPLCCCSCPILLGCPPFKHHCHPSLLKCPHTDHGEGQLSKEPQTVRGIMAPLFLGSEADLERACQQSVPHWSHLENGGNNNDCTELL